MTTNDLAEPEHVASYEFEYLAIEVFVTTVYDYIYTVEVMTSLPRKIVYIYI
jgi:hypothetical protein